jgi:hypothetical protein
MAPETAAIEALADALIRLDAHLPARIVVKLYPRLPAQTIILLSRVPDNDPDKNDVLMKVFTTTSSRDLWLAAGNLLAEHPPPGFSRSLLAGFVLDFAFRVVSEPSPATAGDDGGCAGDFFMTRDPAFADWPKARMYGLNTSGRSRNVFAPGIHPVGFTFWETTDYRDPWEDGDCSPSKSRDWRAGLLAELLGKTVDELPLKQLTRRTLVYTSMESFEDEARTAIQNQTWAFQDVAASLVRSGALSFADSWALEPRCRIELTDDRPYPRDEIPSVAGKWCTAAVTPKLQGVGVPE